VGGGQEEMQEVREKQGPGEGVEEAAVEEGQEQGESDFVPEDGEGLEASAEGDEERGEAGAFSVCESVTSQVGGGLP